MRASQSLSGCRFGAPCWRSCSFTLIAHRRPRHVSDRARGRLDEGTADADEPAKGGRAHSVWRRGVDGTKGPRNDSPGRAREPALEGGPYHRGSNMQLHSRGGRASRVLEDRVVLPPGAAPVSCFEGLVLRQRERRAALRRAGRPHDGGVPGGERPSRLAFLPGRRGRVGQRASAQAVRRDREYGGHAPWP